MIKSKKQLKHGLYDVLIIPLKSSNIKGIKITEKVDSKQLRPAGPFNAEIYLGEKINKDFLSEVVNDPFSPPFTDKKKS